MWWALLQSHALISYTLTQSERQRSDRTCSRLLYNAHLPLEQDKLDLLAPQHDAALLLALVLAVLQQRRHARKQGAEHATSVSHVEVLVVPRE